MRWSPPRAARRLQVRASSRPAQESSSVFADETCSNVSCLLDSERFPGRGGRSVTPRAILGSQPRGLIARGTTIIDWMAKKRQRVGGGAVDQKKLTGWLCAGRAFLGPWCEKYLVLGLEQGLLMGFRKDHRPEALCSDHREGEDKEAIIFLLTGAPNLLPTSLTLNGSYSHHLSSHTLSPIGNSGRLGLLRDSL